MSWTPGAARPARTFRGREDVPNGPLGQGPQSKCHPSKEPRTVGGLSRTQGGSHLGSASLLGLGGAVRAIVICLLGLLWGLEVRAAPKPRRPKLMLLDLPADKAFEPNVIKVVNSFLAKDLR